MTVIAHLMSWCHSSVMLDTILCNES